MDSAHRYDILPLILAGGLGTRLRNVIGEVPKPLANVNGRPFLTYLFDQLDNAGFREALLCTGFHGDRVEATFGNSYRGLRLLYSREPRPLGTAGAVALAVSMHDVKQLLILNGDSYIAFDPLHFLDWSIGRGYLNAMVLTQVEDAARYGRVQLVDECRIIGFEEKDGLRVSGLINAGVYFMQSENFRLSDIKATLSLEYEIIPALLNSGFYGYVCDSSFIDIGTKKCYEKAQEFFAVRSCLGSKFVGL